MKITYFAQLICLVASVTAAPSHHDHMKDLTEFETRYINTFDYQLSNSSIKLIGYKKIHVPTSELQEFENHYYNNHQDWRDLPSTFYDKPSGSIRMYFPVEAALVSHGGNLIEANHLGELPHSSIQGDCAVLGRKQTDHVTGVEGNVIKDGIIYLSNAAQPQRSIGNVNVYDFGIKVLHDHDHEHGHVKRDGKKSCMNNHGGPNCSNKFNIHQGRCPRRSDICVDYNGRWTNCKKGGSRIKNFPSSDCAVALGRGHCWNEVM